MASSTRKKYARPAMSKRSPYKAKSTAKHPTATALSTARKAAGKNSSKEERLKARARAREWARKELGQKKPPPAPPAAAPPLKSSGILVIDDDSDEEVKVADPVTSKTEAGCGMCNSPCGRCKALGRRMLELGIENEKLKKGNVETFDCSDEDVFYDALDSLTMEEVAVEDASDDEEIRDLRSSPRNRVPSRGQSWMEPLEPDGFSFSTWKKKEP